MSETWLSAQAADRPSGTPEPSDEQGPPAAAGAAVTTTPEVGRRPVRLMPDPFVVLDVMMRSLLPGFGGASARLTHGLARPYEGGRYYTREEAARRSGMDGDDVGRLWQALGFAEPAAGQPSYTSEDIQVMSEVARLAADGTVDLDLLIGMVRPMGHLVSRLGAAQVSALGGVLPEQPGRNGPARRPGVGQAGDRLVPLLERLVVHAWRRHIVAAASATMPLSGLDSGARAKAVGFLDIAGYTTLSRRIGWVELAALLERFEAVVFDRVVSSGGRVVKTLGDEVLFVADDAATGAEIALHVLESAHADPRLPEVHGGMAWGALLDRAGDVFGPTVNVASRVADLARPGTVLVDGSYGDRLREDHRFCLERRPRRPVRGYPSLATFRLRRARSLRPELAAGVHHRAVDRTP